IFVRGSVVYTGVVPMGGNHITNDIAVGLRTSIQDAEKIKVASGCAMTSMLPNEEMIEVPMVGGRKSKEISRSVLTKIIEPRVEEILSMVNQEIANSGFKHLMSTGVVITGGASLLEGLPELAEFILEMPVRRGTPQGIGGLLDVVNSPMYSTAVGLLMYGKPSVSEVAFKIRDDENIYGKVLTRMKNWLGDVF
ncbi:MAG: cell division protein FtsA, partial [Deltaproteobacteria bacterium]